MLKSLLADPDNNEGGAAVRRIARAPALLDEVRDILPQLDAALQPADDVRLLEVLMLAGVTFHLGAKGLEDAEWSVWWSHYLSTLAGFPLACIEEAFNMWRRNEMYPDPKDAGRHRFYPQPNEVHALATRSRNTISGMRYRARAAMEHRDAAPPKPITEADREVSRQWLAQNRRPLQDNSHAARASGMPISRTHAATEPPAGPLLDDE